MSGPPQPHSRTSRPVRLRSHRQGGYPRRTARGPIRTSDLIHGARRLTGSVRGAFVPVKQEHVVAIHSQQGPTPTPRVGITIPESSKVSPDSPATSANPPEL